MGVRLVRQNAKAPVAEGSFTVEATELKTRLVTIRAEVLSGSQPAEACDYALCIWDRLEVFLAHGQLEIETNLCYAVRRITKILPVPY